MRDGKTKNKLLKFFFNEEYDIHHRLLNIILVGTFIVGSGACVLSAIKGYSLISVILIAALVFSTVICLFLANYLKKTKLAAIIVSLLANNIFLPLIFITAGGVNSGMPVWFTLGLVIPSLLIDGFVCYIVMGINFVGVMASIFYGYLHSEKVIKMNTEADIFFDICMAIIFVVFVFSLVFKYQAKVHKKQEEKILETMEKAQNATTAKTVFLTNVTHDIRTPMNAIVGYTEIAKRNFENRSKLYDCLTKISISSEHLLSLVNDVLEMSCIESGKLMLQYENASLKQLIGKMNSIVEHELEEKNITLNINLDELQDDSIICDTLRLNQIFLNLLSNAIKYSKPEGAVYFTVTQLASSSPDVVKYEFRVRDEGCGMSEEFKERIYLPFEREKSSTVSGVSGSGLGLSITKNLIEMMDGSIAVNSEIGKGTEFIVRLSFDVPSLSEIVEPVKDTVYDFSDKRVLVVEDNDDNRDIVVEILREAGFEVDEARDGNFAIEKIQLSSVDYYCCVLMDIQMPGKNGYETTKIIRSFEKPGIEKLPIIALSANVYEEDRRKALEVGMDGYITKPFNIKELLKLLNYIIEEDQRQ